MGRTACTEPQCLYKGALYLYLFSDVETVGNVLTILKELSHLNLSGVDV